MDLLRKNKKTILCFILPALVIFLLVAAVPIVCTILLSFFDWNVSGLNGFTGIKNYTQLFSIDRIFQGSVLNTLKITALCLIIQMPLAIFLAYLLRSSIIGKNFFKTVYFIPNIISGVAIGLMWTFILHPDFGVINSLLRILGLSNLTRAWLGDADTALFCVVAAVCWRSIGYHMIIFLCAIESIPTSISEAAVIDGASPWKMFWSIVLPIIIPIIKIDAVLIITGSLRIFDMVYTMTSGGPNHASEVIATHMYTRAFKGMQFGYGSAMAVVLMFMCIAATVLLNKIFKRAEENVL